MSQRIDHYAIIGGGMMGQEHMRNIALLPDAQVTAVVEPDPTMAARCRGLAPTATIMADLDQLFQRDAAVPIDAVVVATPNHLHAAHLRVLLERTTLPVLLEKPAVVTTEQASDVLAAANGRTAPIWIAMEYRYMPAINDLIDQAQAGAVGDIKMVSIREYRFPFLDKVGQWNRFNQLSGGTMVEKCCHFFDLMRLICGAEPARVVASGGTAVNHLQERVDGQVPDILDHGYVAVDFHGGRRAALELCMFAEGMPYQEEIVVLGDAGTLIARVPGPTRFWQAATQGPQPEAMVGRYPRDRSTPEVRHFPLDPALRDAGDHNGATFHQHTRFQAASRGAGPVEVSLYDGVAAVRMGLTAETAIATGSPVAVPR